MSERTLAEMHTTSARVGALLSALMLRVVALLAVIRIAPSSMVARTLKSVRDQEASGEGGQAGRLEGRADVAL